MAAALPLAAQTIPAKFIPTFLVYYGGGPALVSSDAAKLAKFDLIDIDRFRYNNIGPNTWAAIKSINPNVQIYLYQMGSEANNFSDATAQVNLNNLGRYDISRGHPMGSLNGNHPELFLFDAYGKRLYSGPYSKVGANQYWYLMDFGSAAYQSYWMTGVKADILDQPWVADGIFADNCLTLPGAGGYSGTSAWYSTNATWSAAMNSFVGAISAGLHGYRQKLWCNRGDSNTSEGNLAWLTLDSSASPPDVILEGGAFAVSWGSGAVFFYGESDWKNQVDTMGAIRNSKVAMMSHTKLLEGQAGTDNYGLPVTYWQTLWYSLGSFLLGKNDALNNAYFSFSGNSATYDKIWWNDEYDHMDLGKALGPYTVATIGGVNIYSRAFEKGYVYVNPTPVNVASVTLPQASRQLTHDNLLSPLSSIPSVNAIALSGHSAAILLKANATAPTAPPANAATPAPVPTPYSGVPIAIPGTFEAENFDLGGEGLAYHDNTKGNQGGQYRLSEDVDIIVSTDSLGGGYVVNNFETGEWLAYTVNVAASAQYDIALRVTSGFSNSAFHIEIDGVNVTGSVLVPNTGGWSTFQWVTKLGVPLSAGKHVLKIVADQQYFDLNSVRVTATPVSTPYTGTPIAIPGSFEAENFDLGGEGLAYHDNTKGNQGGQYRLSEDVDIIVSTDSLGGGYVVNNFETGEWLAYTVNVAASAQYDIALRVTSGLSNSAFHIEIDGVNVTGSVLVPNTGGWSTFQWVTKLGVPLSAGKHLLKIVADQQYFNLNSIQVLATFSSSPLPPGSAKLLFSSGFEGATALNAPYNVPNAWQEVVGTDSTTGFTWPPNIWGGGTSHFQMIVQGATPDATTLSNYQVNRIETVTGHNGTPTRALYSEIKQSGCTGTNPMGSCVDQDAFLLQPPGETSDLYMSYWIKYQPDIVQKMNPPSPNWRVLFEWKTGFNGDNGDYRVTASLVTWGLGGPLSWHMTGDNVASAGSYTQVRYWEQYTTTTAQTLADWMKFEVFWHRSSGADGRVWMAVNGQVILDRFGSNMGVNNAPINRIFMPNLYGSTAFPIYQWVDDLQIWDGFPPNAAPH
jgi:hypothetical protein